MWAGPQSESSVAPKSDWITERKGHDQNAKGDGRRLASERLAGVPGSQNLTREGVAGSLSLAAGTCGWPGLGGYPRLRPV